MTLSGPTAADCKYKLTDESGHYSGMASSTAMGSYSLLKLDTYARVQTDGNSGSVSMASRAQEHLQDSFLYGPNLPFGSFLMVVVSLSADSVGSTPAYAGVDVNMDSAGEKNRCSTSSLGWSTCSTLVPTYYGSPANLTIYFYGAVGASCGPPDCREADSQGRAEAKVLLLRVVDYYTGVPVKQETIFSSSGHSYPTHFASTVSLTASPNRRTPSDTVTFTATVASMGRSGPPNGRVTFTDSTIGRPLGVRWLKSGIASLTTSFSAVGTHTITARYRGDLWSAASDTTINITVN